MRRHAIGVIALLLLSGALSLWVWPSWAGENSVAVEAAFWRVGTLMAVLWIAWPDLERLPVWMLAFAPVALLAIAFRPRWAIYLIPILVVIALLRPRKKEVPRLRRPPGQC